MLSQLISGMRRLITIPADNPELLKAQYRAFSRQMPMMYFILTASTWAVAATHVSVAPLLLTMSMPLFLTIAAGLRFRPWWRSRRVDPSAEIAFQALQQANYLGAPLAIAFTGWSLMLFPYGDAATRSHAVLYMAITAISCIFFLIHLRAAAITVTAIVNGAFIVFSISTGQAPFIATALNVLLVSAGMLVVLNINNEDFKRMINGQIEARRREQAQSRLLRMIDDMPLAVMTVDPQTFTIDYANETSKKLIRSIGHLLPIEADALVGTCIDAFHRHPEHQRRILSDPANLPYNARISLGPEVLDVNISAITDSDGSYLGPMQTWAIVTKEVDAENHIRFLAHYDALTGLGNRVRFNEQLKAANNSPSLLFVDLDGFKLVNDTFGHRIGDDLLRQVADRLRAVCHEMDVAISRLGGDEFAVLIPHTAKTDVEQLANQIINTLSQPFDLEQGRQIQIGASIGIACAAAGENGETLLVRADLALYAAKAAGKRTYRVFASEMESRIQHRLRLQTQLRRALENGKHIFVFYQPIVDMKTKKVTAREALVRWHLPDVGWVSPADFVPIAEEGGLIHQLGEFVLNTACREAAGWADGARVAVNVSAAQLGKGTIVQTVLSALATSGLSPNRLEIEVTETAMLDDEYGSIGDLRRLRDLGVRLALDDFGTGYSSLTHLRAFPYDKIKIDGSFVRDAVNRPESAAIIRAIADLGNRLGVTTVAEGVETETQLNRVFEEGCSEVQGYFYGAPVPSDKDAARVAELDRVRDQLAKA